MKTILITGAGGFIGRELVIKLSENKKNSILAVDNNIRGNLNSIIKKKNITTHNIDLTNKIKLEKLFKEQKITDCFHLAAINGTKNFYNKPDIVLDVGLKGTLHLLELVRKYNLKKFIFFSSSEVYQKPILIPTKETEPLKIPDIFNPRFSYGGSKIIGELITVNYLRKSKTKYNIIRPHNVYGPNMGSDHVLPELITKLKNYKKKLKIIGSGNDSRSFIYIDDAVAATLKVFYKGASNQIYNIGSNKEFKIKKIIKILSKILNKSIKIQTGARHVGSVSRRKPCIKKIKFLGHKNKISFIQGLIKMLKFYYYNEN
jgi:UDP-glucose 4-epimerase